MAEANKIERVELLRAQICEKQTELKQLLSEIRTSKVDAEYASLKRPRLDDDDGDVSAKGSDDDDDDDEIDFDDVGRKAENWVKDDWDADENGQCPPCCVGGDCWYKGNMDRLSGATVYRLKGTTNVFMCDVCYDNSCYEHVRDFNAARF